MPKGIYINLTYEQYAKLSEHFDWLHSFYRFGPPKDFKNSGALFGQVFGSGTIKNKPEVIIGQWGTLRVVPFPPGAADKLNKAIKRIPRNSTKPKRKGKK